ncbi:MAG TPA: DUF3099 domain-containing protein [Jatrophihabitantaceae bacterium]|jgi:hypothetical protein
MRKPSADQPALITTVPISNNDEYDRRKKKYAIMMATRAVCIVLAACFVRVSVPVAVIFGIAGLILPWCAVIIANDGPAKKKHADLGHVARSTERALPSGNDDRVVDG